MSGGGAFRPWRSVRRVFGDIRHAPTTASATSVDTAGPTLPNSGPREGSEILLLLSGLMSGTMVASLTQTIVFTALPSIGGDLGGLDKIAWVATVTLLAATASTPIYGKLSDQHGRKSLFQVAMVLLLVSSALAGLAQNIWHLIAARAVQGVGAGGLMTIPHAIIGDIIPPRERGRYHGYMMLVVTASTMAGPLLGGVLVDALSWRWVFFIPLPFGIAGLIIIRRALKVDLERASGTVDYVGAAFLVTGVSCLLLAVLWGGTQYAWGSVRILGLGTGSIFATALFIWRQHRAPDALLPPRLFRISVFNVTNAASFTIGFTAFGAFVFLPLFTQFVTGASASLSGLLMLPLSAGLTATSLIAGRVISRVGRYRVMALVGSALVALSFVLMSGMGADTSRIAVGAYMVIMGFGIGMSFPVLLVAVQNAVEHRDLGAATSSLTFFRGMGATMGIAVFGAIMANRLAFHLGRLLPAEALISINPASVRGSPAQVLTLPLEIRRGVVESFALSLQAVFFAAIPVAIGTFAILLFLRELPLGQGASSSVKSHLHGSGSDTRTPY